MRHHPIFDYLLESYCNIGFVLFDETKEYILNENLDRSNDDNSKVFGEALLNLVSTISPMVVSAMIYDGIGQRNIKNILLKKIEDLEVNVKENQYKLFLLYFLWIDIDLKANKNFIEKIFANITLPTLKVLTCFKLNFYFSFKAYNDKSLANFLEKKIKESQLRLDNQIDISDLQRKFAKKSKENLLKNYQQDLDE